MTTNGFETHDHTACISDAIATADRICAHHKLQLTPVRRRVLEILLDEHKALGAYQILDRLRDEGLGSQPPVVYRALEFLVQNRLAHRVERRNAFIACGHPERPHAPAFLICQVCDAVVEAASAPGRDALCAAAAEIGFQVDRTVIEAEGICPRCIADAQA